MKFLSAPMETSVIVNRPGPGQTDTSKMADTLSAEGVRGMSTQTILLLYMPIRHKGVVPR